MAARSEFKSQNPVKLFTNNFKEYALTIGIQDIPLPFDCYSVYPLKEDYVLCLCKDNVIRVFNLKTMDVTKSRHFFNLATAKVLFINDEKSVLLYHRRGSAGIVFDMNTLVETGAIRSNFLEIASINQKWFIARTYDKPDTLLVFSELKLVALNKPLAKISIKENSKWTVVNDTVVKIPEDKRGLIKFYQVQKKENSEEAILKELKSMEYDSFNSKNIKILNVQSYPADNAFSFTVNDVQTSQYKSYLISLPATQHVFQAELIVKLPDHSFLCVEPSNKEHGVDIKGRLQVWNPRTRIRYLLNKPFLPDMTYAGSIQSVPMLLVQANLLRCMTSCEFKKNPMNASNPLNVKPSGKEEPDLLLTAPESPTLFQKTSPRSPDAEEYNLLDEEKIDSIMGLRHG